MSAMKRLLENIVDLHECGKSTEEIAATLEIPLDVVTNYIEEYTE